MRSLKKIKNKYFISDKNGRMVFQDIGGTHYTGVWSLFSYSYVKNPRHPTNEHETFKRFSFNESIFKKIREYHFNKQCHGIDYKWLEERFKVDLGYSHEGIG